MNYELSYSQKYYQENKERIQATRKERASRTHAARKAEGIKHRENNQALSIWKSARNNACSKKQVFDILVEDVVIPTVCPYLGVPITNIQGHGRIWTNASLDRIDSTKGYVKGNIQVISIMANCMKQHATVEQLLEFSKGIQKLHGNS